MKITVVGLGYVGLSNPVLLAQHHQIRALEVDPHRVALVNNGQSPIEDADISDFLTNQALDLQATTDSVTALTGAEFVIIATPTNYDSRTNRFDTSSVEQLIGHARALAAEATIVVKSTVPVGFVTRMRAEHGTEKILFSPEFLREGRAFLRRQGIYPRLVGNRLMQSVLITGSAGFIGFHLSQLLLAQRFRVIGVDSRKDRYDPRLKFDREHPQFTVKRGKARKDMQPMRSGDVPATWADNHLLHKAMGYARQTTARGGMRANVECYREYHASGQG